MSLYRIPNGYERNKKVMLPAYLRGFEHYFYANLDEVIDDSDFDNWVLSMYDMTGTEVVGSVGVLNKDQISVDGFRFYASFTIPANTAKGQYFFAIHNSATTDLKFQSNCFKVIADEDVPNYTLLFFRNSSNAYNFNYQGVNNYNTVFLNLNVIGQEPEVTLNQNRERSTGEIINLKTQTAKVLTVEAFYFDEQAGDAMLALSTHDDIKLNGKKVTVKTAYKPEVNKKNSVEKGTMEFYDQKYSTINLHG